MLAPSYKWFTELFGGTLVMFAFEAADFLSQSGLMTTSRKGFVSMSGQVLALVMNRGVGDAQFASHLRD